MALDEPSHPPSDVDGEGGDEERRDELHDRQLGVVLALAPCQAQAQSSWSGAFRKGALDEEGEREDGVVDQDEGAEDHPVELVHQVQVWLAVLDKAVVRVEDEEGAEGNVEQHDGHVHVSCCEPRLNN